MKPLRKTSQVLVLLILILAGTLAAFAGGVMARGGQAESPENSVPDVMVEKLPPIPSHPMAIEHLQNRSYPASPFVLVEELPPREAYTQSVVTYQSEGLNIRGLLTIPTGPMPPGGFPGVIFIHGYIPPAEYSTTRNYSTYQARLARHGFVTFKPDLRGHGKSEGEPVKSHYSEKYLVDTLFSISALANHEKVNPEKLLYWGHSNGGQIGLRVIVLDPRIQAASLWAGVVGSYVDQLETYNSQISFLQDAKDSDLVQTHGWPSENPEFWNQIEPYAYLDRVKAPVQILHGTEDYSVPIILSRQLRAALERAGVEVDYREYPGDDHNLSQNVDAAFARTIQFYRRSLGEQ
ncbi:MAG: alpha/beta fold hydrolase [Spirochaetales bacterium]|nr:alpha/beta fold hydrolase [Spirochaetales bacterium]